MNEQRWVEAVGDLIIARLRGVPNEAVLHACQEQVLQLAGDLGHGRVLYDVLEMIAPPAEVTFVQQHLDARLGGIRLRRAIVVPNSRLAYLARIAFGDGDYRVFYNDMTAAIEWLNAEAPRHLRMA